MDLSPPMATAVEKSDIQESLAFEQVTVYLTEDILLDFDPYLFALSGNNLQQYCTLLSWLEMRKHNSEVYLQSEEGVATPLSLVHIEEEFNTSPSLYQGGEVAQTKEPEKVVSLARLQYNFVQEANLPTRSAEFCPAGEIVSLFPGWPQTYPQALLKDFSTAVAHQQSPLQVKATYVSHKPEGGGDGPQNRQENNPQCAVVAGHSSPKEGHPSEKSPPEKGSHPGNNLEAGVNQSPTSGVPEGTWDGRGSSGGPNSAEQHLSPAPVTPQQASLEGTFRCAQCSHAFECSSASLGGKKVQATNKGVKLPSPPNKKAGQEVEKPYHCPDCGKGFLHQSSIPRHRRLHLRENPSPDSEKQMPNPGAEGGTSFSIKPLVIKRQGLPAAEKLFRCILCDKSYGQRYHLRRHERQKHQVAKDEDGFLL